MRLHALSAIEALIRTTLRNASVCTASSINTTFRRPSSSKISAPRGVALKKCAFDLAAAQTRIFNCRMRRRTWIIYFVAAFLVAKFFAKENPPAKPKAPVDQSISWLLDEQAQLRGIPFGA